MIWNINSAAFYTPGQQGLPAASGIREDLYEREGKSGKTA